LPAPAHRTLRLSRRHPVRCRHSARPLDPD